MSLDVRWALPAAIIAAAPMCYAAKYMTLEQARSIIFPQADEYVAVPVQLTPDQMEKIDRLSGVAGRSANQQVWRAQAKGALVGWFIVDQVIGKHELITYAVGINGDGTVRQVEIVEYLEAYGYQVRAPKWRDQFVGKTVESPLQVGTDIGNISGATLSVRHVTDGIKRLLVLHQTALR